MAAICTSVEADDILTLAGDEQPCRQAYRSHGRKRSRASELHITNSADRSQTKICDPKCPVASFSSQLSWEKQLLNLPTCSMERNLLHEVSALRAAAAAAVAEFTGPLGPSLQLTEPDRREEIGRGKTTARKGSGNNQNADDSYQISETATSTAGENHSNSVVPNSRSFSEQRNNELLPTVGTVFTQHGCPPHGAKAICGRRPRMEDAYTAVPFLLEVLVPEDIVAESEIFPPRIAPLRSLSISQENPEVENSAEPEHAERTKSHNKTSTSQERSEAEPYLETLHFFGVFDGHGGAEAALHCAQTLHQRIAEALAAATDPTESSEGTDISCVIEQHATPSNAALNPADLLSLPSGLPVDLQDSDLHGSRSNDQNVADMDSEEGLETRLEAVACDSASFESALATAFQLTDEEFGKADNAALVGTTAVVSLVGSRHLYVANCGDSRAVLCRAGTAIPLTDDHKAAREDETARVEAAGGQILFWNGVRVMGVLAVSRAIGDHCLRPFVIAQPEVTILARRPDDELLLLASDGLWDVLSNQEACTLANRCLRRARQRGASRQSAARIAATVLTRAAVDRGSRDNVTVLVVDLSSVTAQEDLGRTASTLYAEDAADHTREHDAEERLARMQSQLIIEQP